MQDITIEKLEWDTDFFGYKIGKIHLIEKESLNWSIEKFKELAKGYKLVYVFSETEIHKTKIKLVDQKVTYTQKLEPDLLEKSTDENVIFFNSKIHNFEKIEKLALTSGAYSRFKIDTNFKNQEYERLYKLWILKSVNDSLNTDVLIYQFSQQILGFITIEYNKDNDIANIGLVAVSKEARGRGVATKLIEACKKMALNNNKTILNVITQKENRPAIKLYEKCNFRQKDLTYIYHFWNL